MMIGLTGAFLSSAGGSATTPSLPVVGEEEEEEDDLARIGALGSRIFDYDQAAWHSTDAIGARLDELARNGAQGWVIEPKGDGLSVIYYGKADDAFFALARMDVQGATVTGQSWYTPQQREPLSPLALRLVAAKEAALAQASVLAPCSDRPFNPVVLPPDQENGPISVYLLTPQVTTDRYPFGGHYRLEVDKDGKILSSRAFMKTCFQAPRQEQAKMMFITHLLDPRPTEIHAYMSLWMRKPVAVATTDKWLWLVNGAHISRVRKLD